MMRLRLRLELFESLSAAVCCWEPRSRADCALSQARSNGRSSPASPVKRAFDFDCAVAMIAFDSFVTSIDLAYLSRGASQSFPPERRSFLLF